MLSFQPMRALEFIKDHVTFKLPYDFSYQMKTRKFAYEIQLLLIKALLKGKSEVMYDLRWHSILGII